MPPTSSPMRRDFDAAVAALRAGRLVVYPTDTLLGIGARADDPGAVDRLLEAKGRPPGQPLSVAVSSHEELERWAEFSPEARAFARRWLPGPFTLLAAPSAAARSDLAPTLTGPTGMIGLRIPDHPIARGLAQSVGPITATSANLHGEPAARSVRAAQALFGDRVSVYVHDGPSPSGHPSTLVDVAHGEPRVVRRH